MSAPPFIKAMKTLSRQERFMATVYAMNTLLVQKGVYTGAEFDGLFVQWAEAQRKKRFRKK